MKESKLSNLGAQFLLSLNGRHIGYLKDGSSYYLELILTNESVKLIYFDHWHHRLCPQKVNLDYQETVGDLDHLEYQ